MDTLHRSRTERFISHALIEVRSYKWLPLSIKSAVLLDLSESGLKAEFTGEHHLKTGGIYWITIPMSPLGISMNSNFSAQIICRWFDKDKYRFGGEFINLNTTQKNLIFQITQALENKGLSLK